MFNYLFSCEFKNGDVIGQTQDDVSQTTPGKNAFFDVLQRLDDVLAFTLHNDTNVITVNLCNGDFEMNGLPFLVGSHHPHNEKRTLIYFRRLTAELRQDGTIQEEPDEIFYLGWKATVEGRTIESVIGVA